MFRLLYSNKSERLIRALARNIQEWRQHPNTRPLSPTWIIVSNDIQGSYIQQTLAEHRGIAANLVLASMQKLGAGLAEDLGLVLLQGDALEHALLCALKDDVAAPIPLPALAVVRDYVFSQASTEAESTALRLVQLVRKVARLFEDYSATRPEMLEEWLARPRPEAPQPERWQSALYRALRTSLDRSTSSPKKRVFVHEIVKKMGELVERRSRFLDTPLHIFAPSFLTPTAGHILRRLGDVTNVFVYAKNPCREFWDDLGPEEGYADDTLQEQAGGPMLLARWGRAGQKTFRLLNELSHFDFESDFEGDFESDFESDFERRLERDFEGRGSSPNALLAKVQRDVLVYAPPTPEARDRATPDDSLGIFVCPGPRRELEVVASKIWSLLKRSQETSHRPLCFHEIAVVFPDADQDRYRPHVRSVFEESYDIPHHQLRVPLEHTSRVLEAVDLLLSLPSSQFTRQDILRILTQPSVVARHPGLDEGMLARWCDALGVMHGRNHQDHKKTYIQKDLYNWDQGIKRLVLGLFYAGEQSGEDRFVTLDDQTYLPLEMPASSVESVAFVSTLIRSLIADATFAAENQLSLSEWSEFIKEMISAYVGAESEQESKDILAVSNAVLGLSDLDFDARKIPFRIAAELVRSRLASMTRNLGQPLIDGVAVGPLSALCHVPFRVVFVCGMGEGRFPQRDRKDADVLNLRRLAPKSLDYTEREKDQYQLLELLLSTREHFYLSYVARDAFTGDELAPSAVLFELASAMKVHLNPQNMERVFSRHPLRRYDESSLLLASSAALREQNARALRLDLNAHLINQQGQNSVRLPAVTLPLMLRSVSASTRDFLCHRFRIDWSTPQSAPPAASAASVASVASVSSASASSSTLPYAALRRFLEDPLQGWARHGLGMMEEDLGSDAFLIHSEPFESDERSSAELLRTVLLEHLAELDPASGAAEAKTEDVSTGTGRSLEARYEASARRLELRGHAPTGLFFDVARERHLLTLKAWMSHVRRASVEAETPLRMLRFGRSRNRIKTRDVLPPIFLALRGHSELKMEISGNTDPVLFDPATSVIFSTKKRIDEFTFRRLELRGFLDQVVLSALGRGSTKPHSVYIGLASDEYQKFSFDPITQEDALAYLGVLVEDFLSRDHAYYLPFELALRLRQALDDGETHREVLANILNLPRRNSFGPLSAENIAAPDIDEAITFVTRRFGAYFSRRRTV